MTSPAPIRFDAVRAWLFDHALPLWTTAGLDHRFGGAVETLDFAGRDSERPIKRLRVQARQVYAFSHASLLGSDAKAAADHCWDFLLARGRRPDGGFVRLLQRDGAIADGAADAYDMAFVIYACAWRIRVGDGSALAVAQETMGALDRLLGLGEGQGWGAAEDDRQGRLLNPHMHLLEAAVEMSEATGEPRFAEVGQSILALFRARMFDPSGQLVEAYDADWRPIGGDAQRIAPGHLYEWAWLLHRADAVLGGDHAAEARALYGFAESYGRDAASGLVFDALNGEHLVPERTYRSWNQAEALKAHLAMFEHQGIDTRARIAATLDILLDHYLGIPLKGGWCDRFADDWLPIAPDVPASILYHLVLAFSELLRLEPRLVEG